MSDPKRIGPKEAKNLIEAGEARLICAYEDEDKCNRQKLPWAIPFSDFQLRASTFPSSQKLIFY